jgi:hypothetical protein
MYFAYVILSYAVFLMAFLCLFYFMKKKIKSLLWLLSKRIINILII